MINVVFGKTISDVKKLSGIKKSLWHSPKQHPQCADIIYICPVGSGGFLTRRLDCTRTNYPWKQRVKEEEIKTWCYEKEAFPPTFMEIMKMNPIGDE